MWATKAAGLLALLSAYINAEELPEDPSAYMQDSEEILAAKQRMAERLANPPQPHVPGHKHQGLPKPYEVEIPEEQKQKRRGPRSGYMAGNPLQRHREPTKEELFKQVGLDLETGHASVVRAHAGLTAPSPSLVPTQHGLSHHQTSGFAALLCSAVGWRPARLLHCLPLVRCCRTVSVSGWWNTHSEAAMSVQQILTAANWATYVPDEHKHVVVEFYAPWSVPPSLLAPNVPQPSELPLLWPSRCVHQANTWSVLSTLRSKANRIRCKLFSVLRLDRHCHQSRFTSPNTFYFALTVCELGACVTNLSSQVWPLQGAGDGLGAAGRSHEDDVHASRARHGGQD